MGNGSAHYVGSTFASDGTCVMGTGGTPEEAESAVRFNLEVRENFISLNPQAKLDAICAKPHICSSDMEAAIRCIHAILDKRPKAL